MNTLLPQNLAKSCSLETLFELHQKQVYKSKKQKLIEKRMANALRNQLPKTDTFMELFHIMKFAPYFTRAEKMIWGRMEAVLKKTEELEELIKYWKITRATSRERELVELRMVRMFKKRLPVTNDMSEIIGLWYYSSYRSRARKVLKRHMTTLLRKENNIQRLYECRDKVPVRDELKRMIERRVAKFK
jgi:hypothetical protein